MTPARKRRNVKTLGKRINMAADWLAEGKTRAEVRTLLIEHTGTGLGSVNMTKASVKADKVVDARQGVLLLQTETEHKPSDVPPTDPLTQFLRSGTWSECQVQKDGSLVFIK